MEQIAQPLSSRSLEVLTYWSSLRQGKRLPRRTELQPAALKSRLPDLFLLGWQETELQFRLAGTRICELFDKELRQTNFIHLFPTSDRDRVRDAVLNAITLARACRLDGFTDQQSGFQKFEMLLLPLNSPEGICDRILGCLILQNFGLVRAPLTMGSLRFKSWIVADIEELEPRHARLVYGNAPEVNGNLTSTAYSGIS